MKKQLFWVYTPCNLENWFVVSTSKKEASLFHDYAEGFNPGYSNSKMICDVNSELIMKYDLNEDNWPKLQLLRELGFKIIESKSPRVVSFNGKIFYEGGSIQRIFENEASKASGVYVLNIEQTNKFKVGYSKNITSRLKAFRTALPYKLNLTYFIETRHYVSLEKHIHNELKTSRYKREWFELDEIQIEKLESIFNYLTASSKDFKFRNVKEMLSNYRSK